MFFFFLLTFLSLLCADVVIERVSSDSTQAQSASQAELQKPLPPTSSSSSNPIASVAALDSRSPATAAAAPISTLSGDAKSASATPAAQFAANPIAAWMQLATTGMASSKCLDDVIVTRNDVIIR